MIASKGRAEGAGDATGPAGPAECAAAKVRGLDRSSTIDFVDAVGKIVLEQVYDGDVRLWRSRSHRRTTLRELSARLPGLALSPSTLYRCVATHVLLREHEELRRLTRLTATHIRCVLPLSDADRLDLLRRADNESWSVERLERAVRKRERPVRRGRRPLPGMLRCIERLRALGREAISEYDAESLDLVQLVRAHAALMEVRALLDQLQPRLSPKRRSQE